MSEPHVVDGFEVWDIPDWEGRYGVTKCGKVWSFPRKASNGQSCGGRWLKRTKAPHGYLKVDLRGKAKRSNCTVHRLMGLTFFGVKDGLEIDHINRVRDDNRLENLRVATHGENMQNASAMRGKSSPLKGAYWVQGKGKWCAAIKRQGKKVHLGYYNTEEDASSAYRVASNRLFGDYSSEEIGRVSKEVERKVALAFSGGIKQKVSKFPGVSLRKGCHARPWMARITSAGKTKVIGNFASEEQAAEAYRRAKNASC